MSYSSDILDGKRVYWARNDEWVEYETHSDALVAGLVLCYELPLKALEPVIALLRNEQFRPADVSFTKSSDVYSRIGELRAKRTAERSWGSSVAGFPNKDTFDHVVRVMAEERRRHFEDLNGPSFISERTRRGWNNDEDMTILDTLRSMTLVHRSWTIPSQRVLRYCACIETDGWRHTGIDALVNPTLSFSRTLFFKDRFGGRRNEESAILLKGLIIHPYLNGLRVLHIDLELTLPDSSSSRDPRYMANAMQSLETLQSLEILSFICGISTRTLQESEDFIVSLCDTLTRLQYLDSFRLFCPIFDGHPLQDVNLPSWLQEKHPTSSLKSVDVAIRDASLLSWLTVPRGEFRLDRIGILMADSDCFPFYRYLPQLASAIQPALPLLTSLSTQVAYLSTQVSRYIADDLNRYVKSTNGSQTVRDAISVHTLNLRIDAKTPKLLSELNLDEILDSVSSSTRSLSLLFFLPFRPLDENVLDGKLWKKLDSELANYLSRSENLHRMKIIIDDSSHGNEFVRYSGLQPTDYWRSEISWFPQSQGLCEARNITWCCRVDDVTRYQIV